MFCGEIPFATIYFYWSDFRFQGFMICYIADKLRCCKHDMNVSASAICKQTFPYHILSLCPYYEPSFVLNDFCSSLRILKSFKPYSLLRFLGFLPMG